MQEINKFEGQSLHFFAAVLVSVLGVLWATVEIVPTTEPSGTPTVQQQESGNGSSESRLTARQIH